MPSRYSLRAHLGSMAWQESPTVNQEMSKANDSFSKRAQTPDNSEASDGLPEIESDVDVMDMSKSWTIKSPPSQLTKDGLPPTATWALRDSASGHSYITLPRKKDKDSALPFRNVYWGGQSMKDDLRCPAVKVCGNDFHSRYGADLEDFRRGNHTLKGALPPVPVDGRPLPDKASSKNKPVANWLNRADPCPYIDRSDDRASRPEQYKPKQDTSEREVRAPDSSHGYATLKSKQLSSSSLRQEADALKSDRCRSRKIKTIVSMSCWPVDSSFSSSASLPVLAF